MKSLFSLIFLFLFANSAFAVIPSANLCDTSCNLTISFPSGGSITAVNPMTVTFGTGGVLNLGATGTVNTSVQPPTDFSAGGTLALAVGESISFDAGGSLDLGAGGNLSYSNIAITTDGDINIQAIGGTETIYLYTVTLSGTASLVLTGASISLQGTVDGGIETMISINAVGSSLGCEITSSSGFDLTLTGSVGTPGVIDTSSDCNTLSTNSTINFGLFDVTITSTDPNAGGTISAGDITLNSETQSESGSLNIIVLLFSLLTLIYLRRFELN